MGSHLGVDCSLSTRAIYYRIVQTRVTLCAEKLSSNGHAYVMPTELSLLPIKCLHNKDLFIVYFLTAFTKATISLSLNSKV